MGRASLPTCRARLCHNGPVTMTDERPAAVPYVTSVPLAEISADEVEAAIGTVLPGCSRQPVPVASFGSSI